MFLLPTTPGLLPLPTNNKGAIVNKCTLHFKTLLSKIDYSIVMFRDSTGIIRSQKYTGSPDPPICHIKGMIEIPFF